MNLLKRLVQLFLSSLIISLFLIYSVANAQTEGEWSGSTSESGKVYFAVNGNTVQNFLVEVCVSGGSGGSGCFENVYTFSIPITGNTFSYSGISSDLTGTFINSSTCTGTWSYHDSYMGYGSGTWEAHYPAPPIIILSPSDHNFGEQLIDTQSNTYKFTLVNWSGGTATGQVSLTGADSDQFEITQGGGYFSLTHDEYKDIYVRLTPSTIGSKTAILSVDGTAPCNDQSSVLQGIGVKPSLLITPSYRQISEEGGSVTFNVTNTGTGSMAWTAAADPESTWLTVSGGSSGSNNGTITVSYNANDGDTRLGFITVTAPTANDSPQKIELLQSPVMPEWKYTAADGEPTDGFGWSVGIDGNYAIVGSLYDDDKGSNSGSAYIFEKTADGWLQQDKLTASDGTEYDYFGRSVEISGDYAIVGAYGDGNYTGSAYIFKRTESGWVQQAKLTASDGEASDNFGWAVAISGDYAIVGAYGDESYAGAAYLFEKPSGGWADMTETEKLAASDQAASDYFGSSVSLDGEFVVIGADGDDDNGAGSGSAYIFKRTESGWVQQAKLTASDGESSDNFGCAVSISGDYLVIGASGPNHYVSGETGTAYIFEKPANGWINMTETVRLVASDAGTDDRFGGSVDISGEYAIIGASYDDANGGKSGSSYIFKKTEGDWLQQDKLSARDGAADDHFGTVGISGDYLVIGANGDDDMGYGSGSIYFYFIGNFPPSISAIDDQITDENSPTGSIEITILDPESPPETLIVTETSSDKTLVPDENIVLTGSGFNRNMIITPAPGESGTAEITITVSDGNNEVNESFLLTVVPLPDSDGDGLPDIDEDINNNGFVDIGETDPYNPDTDFDGLYDGVEVKILGTNPLIPDSDGNGIFDGDEDNDGDGFTNMEEVQCGSDPGNPNSKCLNGLPWLMLLLD